jgi:Cu/Ag efflux protein CusF
MIRNALERLPAQGLQRAGVALAVLALTLAGCQNPSPAAAPQADAKSAAQEYSVRGTIVGPTADGREWRIRHEAIPTFVGVDGTLEPMDSMTMPFPATDPALFAGLAAGDRVLFRFRVDWEGSPPLAVLAVEKLPPDTRLSFETPEPAPSAPGNP